MRLMCGLFLLTGLYPLTLAWRRNRRTALRDALGWTFAAWAAWMAEAWWEVLRPGGTGQLGRYGALCLTGCAGVAVLGARRPGMTAWNFVVVGLLAVLLLPVAEGWGEPRLGEPQLIFLIVTLGVPLLNYLPTRLGPAALLLALGCAVEVVALAGYERGPIAGCCLTAAAPWVGLVCIRGLPMPATEFDRLWVGYRDRFGLVWGQRMREQFNRAAANAGWSVHLGWRGLHAAGPGLVPDAVQAWTMLQAVLKRFGPEEKAGETE